MTLAEKYQQKAGLETCPYLSEYADGVRWAAKLVAGKDALFKIAHDIPKADTDDTVEDAFDFPKLIRSAFSLKGVLFPDHIPTLGFRKDFYDGHYSVTGIKKQDMTHSVMQFKEPATSVGLAFHVQILDCAMFNAVITIFKRQGASNSTVWLCGPCEGWNVNSNWITSAYDKADPAKLYASGRTLEWAARLIEGKTSSAAD